MDYPACTSDLGYFDFKHKTSPRLKLSKKTVLFGMIMTVQQRVHVFRFEILLFALVMLLFNKMFVTDQNFYVDYVWPGNMLLLGLASVGVFKERGSFIRGLKNILFVLSLIIPLLAHLIFKDKTFSILAVSVYILYYGLIFEEVMQQITHRDEVTLSIVLGSFCGYLLLILIAVFSFLLVETLIPQSFFHTSHGNIPLLYNELTYFSMVTIASVGYGDITPANDTARLLSSFFGIAGQFYMVALVGIIISKFSNIK